MWSTFLPPTAHKLPGLMFARRIVQFSYAWYLPSATKCRQGNVFTPVCDSVHREGLCPSIHHRSHDQGGLCPGVSLSEGLCPGGLCLGGLCSEGSLSGGSLSRGSLSRESLSGGVSVRGRGLCYGHPSTPDRDPHTVTSGWYAFYWNAFLFTSVVCCFSASNTIFWMLKVLYRLCT